MMVGRGYTSYPAHGSGGTILMCAGRNLVWKIADDPATAEFADFMLTNGVIDPALPRVFAASPKSSPYSILAMEKLLAFSEGVIWDNWFNKDFIANKSVPITDPYGAASLITMLFSEGIKRHVLVDLQSKNVMMRRRVLTQVVLFDPFY
jgi:hypothetical protein